MKFDCRQGFFQFFRVFPDASPEFTLTRKNPSSEMTKPPTKKRRRAKGSGSIFWSARRRAYIGRVPVGRKLDGSTHYVQVSDADHAKCIEKMKRAKAPGPRTTVAEWARRWFD